MDTNKGFVYVIDFNPSNSLKIGIPSLDSDDKIKYNIKIGRTRKWKFGRKEDYSNMNVFSQRVRLLFCCETDDCVKMESFLHRSFINDTLQDPVRRELFRVTEEINTKTKLQDKFSQLILDSGIKSKNVTIEQSTNIIHDIFNEKELDNYIIRMGKSPSNKHINNRILFFEEIKMTLNDFKKNIYADQLLKFGGSKKKPTKYKKADFKYDICKEYLKLVKP